MKNMNTNTATVLTPEQLKALADLGMPVAPAPAPAPAVAPAPAPAPAVAPAPAPAPAVAPATGLADMIATARNGYVRDRKHEKVAVWEVKQTIVAHFNSDNYAPIALAIGNWLVCAGYAVGNRTDGELLALAGRVVALCVNGTHITVKNVKQDALATVFSSGRVKSALYRAVAGDCTVTVKKDEEKPTVKTSANKSGKTSKKEERIVRIMTAFNCTREQAEAVAM